MAASRDLAALLGNASSVAALVDHYERAVDRLIAELAAGVSRSTAGRTAELLRRLNELIDDLDPRKAGYVRRWIRRNAERAYVLGDVNATRAIRRTLRSAGQDPAGIDRTWTAVNAASMAAVVRAMRESFGRIANELRTNLGLFVRRTQLQLLQSRQIQEATVGGILRGATGQQVKDDIAAVLLGRKLKPEIRERLKAVGFRGDMFRDFEAVARRELVQAGARRMKVRDYADLVARTQLREAHKVATVVRLQRNDIDHVQVSKHRQKKVDECTPFAGRVFYIGPEAKDPLGFPRLSEILNGGPPFHPNCRHVLMPYVAALKTGEAVGAQREISRGLPRRFMGKTASEVRALVGDLNADELAALNLQEAA